MALKDSLAATKPRIGAQCSVGKLLDTLSKSERAEYEEALDLGSGHSASNLRAAFIAEGHPALHEGAVQRHRNAECKCRANGAH